MSLFVIGDLHLSLGAGKPMDVFGGAWTGYMDKLARGLSIIGPEDTTVLCGDLSWGMDLDSALEDFRYIDRIPGRKILLKGNHDYWWTTARKFYAMCQTNGFEKMELLHNNCFFYENIALCGTRGWFYEEDKNGTHDEKVFRREMMRLEASLKAAGEREKYCFLHYPPRYRGYECQELIELLERYEVRECCYGHLHSESHKLAVQGLHGGVDYRMVSADYLGFRPLRLL